MKTFKLYAEALSKCTMDFSLFAPNAIEMCPGEGLMDLQGYQKSLAHWFPLLNKIIIKKIIEKSLEVNGAKEYWACIFFEVYYKVDHGEAKVDVTHILKAGKDQKIISVNSFWERAQFDAHIPEHPELKDIFK